MNSINTLEREKFVPLNSGSTAIRSFSRAKIISLLNSISSGVTYDRISAERVSNNVIKYSISLGMSDVAQVDVVYNSETELSIDITLTTDKFLIEDGFLLLENNDLLVL
jgi:hypothetical protein